MPRTILHADANGFYASVEQCYRPALRGKALVVAGDPEARHGIVLAKSEEAKRCEIKTGMAIWQARQLCPNLIVLPPNYKLYLNVSRVLRRIFEQYTDQVEPFGLDEAWLDVGGSRNLFGAGIKIANDIRERVKDEVGITVSVGVGDNKVYAKLGSDYKKPDAVTVMDREKVYPLPAGDLLYVGRATAGKLRAMGIHTIGQLAETDEKYLTQRLGKVGDMLHTFARGEDASPVTTSEFSYPVKSIGNSWTTPRDLVTVDDVKVVIYIMAESVASRLRKHGFRASVIEIYIRDSNLNALIRQRKIKRTTQLSREIADTAMELFRENYQNIPPIRSVGVRASKLVPTFGAAQLSFFEDEQKREKMERMEHTVDVVRRMYGHFAIQRGMMLEDRRLSGVNPEGDHLIHPVGLLHN